VPRAKVGADGTAAPSVGQSFSTAIVVAGIDVGGVNKGHHLAILRDGQIIHIEQSREATCLAATCRRFEVVAIGIDAPSQWATAGGGRAAERALARAGMSCFATPTRERAAANAAGFYDWMFQGEQLYRALAATHPPLRTAGYAGAPCCFETFPHAITCALLGVAVVSAKQKRVQRRQALKCVGIATAALRSIDAVDAALCALAAACLLRGAVRVYGEAADGYIFVPEFSGT
jgi:predicted nuclease with RNAse H fold